MQKLTGSKISVGNMLKALLCEQEAITTVVQPLLSEKFVSKKRKRLTM
jgi:hypothetical protein